MLFDIPVKQPLLANRFFNFREKLLFFAGVMLVQCRVPAQAISDKVLIIRGLYVRSLNIYAVEATEEGVVHYTHCTRSLHVWIGIGSLFLVVST
jgi:hypothetical protein